MDTNRLSSTTGGARGEIADSAEFVDDRVLAARTSLSRITWQVWRSRGKGPPYYQVGRRCLYKWREVERWLESKRVDPK